MLALVRNPLCVCVCMCLFIERKRSKCNDGTKIWKIQNCSHHAHSFFLEKKFELLSFKMQTLLVEMLTNIKEKWWRKRCSTTFHLHHSLPSHEHVHPTATTATTTTSRHSTFPPSFRIIRKVFVSPTHLFTKQERKHMNWRQILSMHHHIYVQYA